MTHSQRKCVLILLVVDWGKRGEIRPQLKGSTALAVRLLGLRRNFLLQRGAYRQPSTNSAS